MFRAALLGVSLAVMAAACSGNTSSSSSDTADSSSSGTAGDPVLSEDASVKPDSPAGAFTVSVGPSANAGLVAMVTVDAASPIRARVSARSGDHVVETPETTEAAETLEIPVVGLRSNREYELQVEIDAGNGDMVVVDEVYTTEELPDWITEQDVTIDAERSSPGYTIIEVDPQSPEDEGPFTQYLLAYDNAGEVVWYYTNFGSLGGVEQTPSGTFLMHYWPYGVREVDVTGEVVAQWRPQPIDVPPGVVDDSALLAEVDPDQVDLFGDVFVGNDGDAEPTPVRADWVSLAGLHHDNWLMPNGNLLVLSTTNHELTPDQRAALCPGDPNEFDVISDVVVEHERDGTVVRTWDLWDAIDVLEFPGSSMCIEDDLFAEPERRDWTHANSVTYDPVRDAVIVSVRHTDQIVAFDHLDTEGPQADVRWILGAGSTMPLDGEPSYHQHAVEVLDDGSLIVFDNGNGRPGTSLDDPANPPYSRAVIYDVDDSGDDPATWSATQRWDFTIDEDGAPVYTSFISDADPLANGNVLITFGGIGAFPPDPDDPLHALIVEVEPSGASGGDVVATFASPLETPITVYRSERIESFYVGPQWSPRR